MALPRRIWKDCVTPLFLPLFLCCNDLPLFLCFNDLPQLLESNRHSIYLAAG